MISSDELTKFVRIVGDPALLQKHLEEFKERLTEAEAAEASAAAMKTDAERMHESIHEAGLRMLAESDKRSEEMKAERERFMEEHRVRVETLDKREASLNESQARLDAAVQDLSAKEQDLAVRVDEHLKAAADLEGRMARFNDRERKLGEDEHALRAREDDLAGREAAFKSRVKNVLGDETV